MLDNLTKIIAASGLCSRRQAEDLIRKGKVKVNGLTASLGDKADSSRDQIRVSGRPLSATEKTVYIKLNKPVGYTCTNRTFAGEKNIFELIKLPLRLFAIGRLDKDSRGLILLTNDGALTQKLSHPKFGHEKIYEVKVNGEVRNVGLIINKLIKGVKIGEEQEVAHIKKAEYLQNNIFILTLTEGKKRQIREMFSALEFKVIDLKRIGFGGLELGDLKEGAWAYLSPEEINKIK